MTKPTDADIEAARLQVIACRKLGVPVPQEVLEVAGPERHKRLGIAAEQYEAAVRQAMTNGIRGEQFDLLVEAAVVFQDHPHWWQFRKKRLRQETFSILIDAARDAKEDK